MKFICFVVFIISVVLGDIDDNCLNCICQVESNFKAVGCNPDAGSLSCGFFQIKKPYYADCVGKKPGEVIDEAWKNCANDLDCAKKCVRDYLNRYAAKCRPNPDCEVYARVHNGGPNGCKSSSTIEYWNRVKKCLK